MNSQIASGWPVALSPDPRPAIAVEWAMRQVPDTAGPVTVPLELLHACVRMAALLVSDAAQLRQATGPAEPLVTKREALMNRLRPESRGLVEALEAARFVQVQPW